MIIYNSNSITASGLAQAVSQFFNIEAVEVSTIKLEINTSDELVILFINVFGEEELNIEWEEFLKKKFIKNQRIIVFLFGVYDEYIDKDSIIVKQIYYYLKIDNKYIEIFPKKLSKFNLNLNEIKDCVLNIKNKSIVDDLLHKEILSLSHINQKSPLIYNEETLNLTCGFDGFSNLLNSSGIDSYRILNQILRLSSQKNIICNRVDLSEFDYGKIINNRLEKLYFKSCLISKTPELSNFINLKLVNFSANKIKELIFDNFPNNVKRVNFSKNCIEKIICGNDFNYNNIESIALFNNRLSDFEWLDYFKNVKYLNIGMNPISEFPKEILGLKDLEYLNVAVTDINRLPEGLLQLSNLKKIDIKHCVNLNLEGFIFNKLSSNGVEIIC
ncbi:leucine-rich repeat domain-containing protein [Acinetobacter towneri]|uniref:leucine-rich repeat domain-containing protein n=1 Tax=Acinetobacter towneri TaxID=202956 RepID=UPI0029348835|nr:hypothetical protein [Acinetobacter towneri]WOE27725.1 hypothetical protein QSG83_09790 [Acinetobacter towneri]